MSETSVELHDEFGRTLHARIERDDSGEPVRLVLAVHNPGDPPSWPAAVLEIPYDAACQIARLVLDATNPKAA